MRSIKVVSVAVAVAAICGGLVWKMHTETREQVHPLANENAIQIPQKWTPPEDAPPAPKWFIAESSFSKCIETGGPAERIDGFGTEQRPNVVDTRDATGKVARVEVSLAHSDMTETVWTYYRSQAACEAEQVNTNKSLADKYR